MSANYRLHLKWHRVNGEYTTEYLGFTIKSSHDGFRYSRLNYHYYDPCLKSTIDHIKILGSLFKPKPHGTLLIFG